MPQKYISECANAISFRRKHMCLSAVFVHRLFFQRLTEQQFPVQNLSKTVNCVNSQQLIQQAMVTLRGMAEHMFSKVYN